MKQTSLASRILSWLISLLVPVVLILLAVRLVLAPWYIELEYRTPGFPADPYGFTLNDRLQYAHIAREYLINEEDISFLGDLRFPPGQEAPPNSCMFMDDCTRLYNDRELKHMVDVKNTVRAAMTVLYVGLGLLILLGVWAWRGGWLAFFLRSVNRGGWITLPVIFIVILLVLASFGVFFVFFHDVFFAPGTWTFYYSDTLIRLFPERFWRDTFLVVGALTALGSLLVASLTRLILLRPPTQPVATPE